MPILDNPRHETFSQALAQGLSADAAYQVAGYEQNRSNAARLKADDGVAARVAELKAAGAARAEIDIARTVKELRRLALSDLRNAFDADGRLKKPQDWSDDFAAAVSSVEVVTRPLGEGQVEYVHKIKTWDKNSALEKVAKHLGMFVERHEHTGRDGTPLVLDNMDLAKALLMAIQVSGIT